MLRDSCRHLYICFFFNDTATTEIYTLSLHDALPISKLPPPPRSPQKSSLFSPGEDQPDGLAAVADRKSTRLNSSHANISYAVFCLKKKNAPRKVSQSLFTLLQYKDLTSILVTLCSIE